MQLDCTKHSHICIMQNKILIQKCSTKERISNSNSIDKFLLGMYGQNIRGIKMALDEGGSFLNQDINSFLSRMNNLFIQLSDMEFFDIEHNDGVALNGLIGSPMIEFKFNFYIDKNAKLNQGANSRPSITLRFSFEFISGKIFRIVPCSSYKLVGKFEEDLIKYSLN